MLVHLIPSGLDPKIDKEHVQGGGHILRRPSFSHRMLYEQAQGLMKERKVMSTCCRGSDALDRMKMHRSVLRHHEAESIGPGQGYPGFHVQFRMNADEGNLSYLVWFHHGNH